MSKIKYKVYWVLETLDDSGETESEEFNLLESFEDLEEANNFTFKLESVS